MKKIHPAIAEHVMEENERLREVLRRIADLPIDPCSTENDYRLSGAKAIAEGALSQQAEPLCEWPTCECALEPERCKQAEPAPAQDGRELPAPDITTKHGYPAYSVELVSRLLCTRTAKTEQQWPTAYPHEAMDKMAADRYRVGAAGAGTLHRYAVRAGDGEQELYRGSESDCQSVARKLAGAFLDGGLAFQAMLAAPIAQTAPQPEQSGLVEALKGMLAIHDEPSGFAGKYGRALDEAVAAQEVKIGIRIAAARAALSAQGDKP